MKAIIGAAVLGMGAVLATGAQAVQVTFDFGVLAPDTYNSIQNTYPAGPLTFTHSAGGSVTASVEASILTSTTNENPALTQRSTQAMGAAESGLGILRDANETTTEREIDKDEFVRLNFSDVLTKGGSVVSVKIGSLQNGEGYAVYSSTVDYTTFADVVANATLVKTGIGGTDPAIVGDVVTVSLSSYSAAPFVFVTSSLSSLANDANDNVLGTAVVLLPSAVPEPVSLALLGIGVAGLGLTRRRAG